MAVWSGGMSRTEVAEWEEPRHPGPAVHMGSTPLHPTLQHNCRHRPTRLESGRMSDLNRCPFAGLPAVGRWWAAGAGRTTGCRSHTCRRLASIRGRSYACRPFRRWMWKGRRQGLRRDSNSCSAPPCSRSPAPRWRSCRRRPAAADPGLRGDADPGLARARVRRFYVRRPCSPRATGATTRLAAGKIMRGRTTRPGSSAS